MKTRILIVTLCLLSCLAFTLQLAYESGAVVQGFPASRALMLLFWWQVASVPMVILSSALGLFRWGRHPWLTSAVSLLAAVYPVVIAVNALLPSTWDGWLTAVKSVPQQGLLRLAVVCLPALFTVSLWAVLSKQRRFNQVSQVPPVPVIQMLQLDNRKRRFPSGMTNKRDQQR